MLRFSSDDLFGRLHLSPDGDGDGGGGEPKPGAGDPPPKKPSPLDALGLDDEKRTEVQRLIDRAAKAAKTEGEVSGRTAAEQAAIDQAETERVERERQQQIKAGEFEKVRVSLEKEVNDLKADRDALQTEVDALNEQLEPIVAEQLKGLEEAEQLGFPKDGDLLAQLAWLNDPRTIAVLSRRSEEQAVADAKNGFRPPVAPQARRTTTAPTVAQTTQELRAARGLPTKRP